MKELYSFEVKKKIKEKVPFDKENKKGEIYIWKEFSSNMPISIEYNIYFE